MNDQLSEYVRKQFPALNREINGQPIAYLDGPGGYQVPESVIAAVKHYLIDMNANVGDQFDSAQNTSTMIRDARDIFAEFFNCSWDEVVFGANMTTLNFALAQALARQMTPGDTVLITEMDHEANRGPWLQLQDRGIDVAEVAVDIGAERVQGEERLPGVFDAIFGTFQILQRALMNEKLEHARPDIYVRPEIRDVRLMQFEKMDQVYEQCLPALEQFKKEIAGFLGNGGEGG